MKALLGPLVLIVGAVIGFGGSEWAKKATSTETGTDTEQAASGTETEANLELELEETDTDAGEETAPRPTGVREILERIPPVEIETIYDTISGRVIDRRGTPVAGVRIEARVVGAPPSRASRAKAEDESEVVAIVRGSVAEHQYQNALLEVVETGSDGRFEIGDLVAAPYSVSATKRGYAIESRRHSGNVEPGGRVIFIAEQSRWVDVDVRLPDGQRPESASISFTRGNNSQSKRWKPDAKRLSVPAGRYRVSASSGSRTRINPLAGDDYRSDTQSIDLRREGAASLRFDMKAQIGIRGTVVRPEGVKGNYRIRWMQLPTGGEPDLAVLDKAGERFLPIDDTFKMLDIPAGTYLVGAQLIEGRFDGHAVVEVQDGIAEAEIEITPISADDVVIVWAFDDQGQMLEKFSASFYFEGPGRSGSVKSQTIQQADGSHWLVAEEEFWTHLDDPDARVYLDVRTSELGSKRVEVTSTNMRVVFRAPAHVTVRVGNYFGTPAEGRLDIQLRPAGETRRFSRSESSPIDSDGSMRFGPHEAGPYTLEARIRANESDWQGTLVEAQRLDLVSGENSVTVSLPRLRSLRVHFPESVGKVRVSVMSLLDREPGGASLHGSPQQPVEIPSLPEGEYLLVAIGAQLSMMKVEVQGDTEIDFEPVDIDALKVRVDSGSPLHELGFRDGDLIVGVNGLEFENGQQLQMALMGAMSRDKVSLSIDRAGEVIRLEVKGSALEEAGGRGQMVPANRELRIP